MFMDADSTTVANNSVNKKDIHNQYHAHLSM